MAVKGCAPAPKGAQTSAPAPLSPLLRLYEQPVAHTDVAVPAPSAPRTVRMRIGPSRAHGRRAVRPLYTPARYAPTRYSPAQGAPALVGVARAYNIDPAFLGSLIQVESGANPRARSAKGAIGLMQVTPGTARRFGVASPGVLSNPTANLVVGAAYLKTLQRRYGNNLPLILAAYNAGEGAVARYHNRIPHYHETMGYVANVLGRYRNAISTSAVQGGGSGLALAMR
jgi:soluble lytic murein transglycosylase-like protein